MKVKIKETEYYLEQKPGTNPGWLLLHGFMGSHADFSKIMSDLPATVTAPDLLGHGQTISACSDPDFSIEQQADQLALLICQYLKPPLIVWGYSMGGRVALALSLRHPQLVKYLILESSTAGIANDKQRKARQQHDIQLAGQLRDQGLTTFVDRWEQLPLFATQQKLPSFQRNFIRQQRLNQKKQGLARSLAAMGTGQMPNYWPALAKLQIPVLLLAGEQDLKFQRITAKMATLLPHSQRFVVPAAGHNIHLENWTSLFQIFKQERLI